MTKFFFLAGCAAAMATMSASAVPINITVDLLGLPLNGNGTADSLQYGQVDNSAASNLTFLNNEIGLWNAVYNPDMPIGVSPVAFDAGVLADTTYTALPNYDYVVFHFESGDSDFLAGYWQSWYLNGTGGSFSVPVVAGQPFGTFTSARYFNQADSGPPGNGVPDGGATITLLGLGVVALETLRRKTVKA